MLNFVNGKKLMNPEIIDAKKVTISDYEIRQIAEIEQHPDVKKWLVIHVEDDVEKEFLGYKHFFKDLHRESEVEVLISRYDERIAGFLMLWRLEEYMEHVASVGISVHPNYWGKGVATQLINSAIELARKRGLKRLEIETIAGNLGMRRAAEKAGFKFESLRPKRLFKNGTYHDEATYYLLLEET